MGCINSKKKEPETIILDIDTSISKENHAPKPPPLEERKQAMMASVEREILKERALIRNVENQILFRFVGELNGIDISVDGIKNSELYVFDISAQVQIDEASNSKILIGPCEGSVFIRNCKDCTFYIMGNQLRTRDCENCTIYLYCPTEPVIEMSHGLKFGTWNVAYPGLKRLYEELSLDKTTNQYDKIHDFTPNHESLPPVHWALLTEAEVQAAKLILVPEKGEPYDGEDSINPVNGIVSAVETVETVAVSQDEEGTETVMVEISSVEPSLNEPKSDTFEVVDVPTTSAPVEEGKTEETQSQEQAETQSETQSESQTQTQVQEHENLTNEVINASPSALRVTGEEELNPQPLEANEIELEF